jgi:hypothetical protein
VPLSIIQYALSFFGHCTWIPGITCLDLVWTVAWTWLGLDLAMGSWAHLHLHLR